MATLVNKMNRDVKVIIPNMREFRVFYSDNEGSVMFFKRDWREEKQDEHWKPSEEQIRALKYAIDKWESGQGVACPSSFKYHNITELYEQLKKL